MRKTFFEQNASAQLARVAREEVADLLPILKQALFAAKEHFQQTEHDNSDSHAPGMR